MATNVTSPTPGQQTAVPIAAPAVLQAAGTAFFAPSTAATSSEKKSSEKTRVPIEKMCPLDRFHRDRWWEAIALDELIELAHERRVDGDPYFDRTKRKTTTRKIVADFLKVCISPPYFSVLRG